MIEVSHCVVCNHSGIRTRRRALVAPFLAQRIWGKPAFDVKLVECGACGFLFYNPRLEAPEEQRLYDGYRSPRYQQMRHGAEPWYTERFNADLASKAWYAERRQTIASLLGHHLNGQAVQRVLDYGGAGGDLVCGLIEGAEAFSYDISSAPTTNGVHATSNPAECAADLIVNSNVLEHVGFPQRLVDEMKRAAPPGGLLYVEVPCELPFGPNRLLRRVVQMTLVAVCRPSLARTMLRPSALFLMHEHVNYFTERSLCQLMVTSGCAIKAAGAYVQHSRAGTATMAWCLVKR